MSAPRRKPLPDDFQLPQLPPSSITNPEFAIQARHIKRLMRAEYTPERADYILQEIASGRTLDSICREEHMPTAGAVVQWANYDKDGFFMRYNRAVAVRAEIWADQIIAIADDDSGDFKEDKDGRLVVDMDNINRAKLRIQARQWYVSKILPKRYGDALMLKAGDTKADAGQGPAPIRIVGVEPVRKVIDQSGEGV